MPSPKIRTAVQSVQGSKATEEITHTHTHTHTQTFTISILNIHILEEIYEGKFRGWSGYLARITERNVLKNFRCEIPLEWEDMRHKVTDEKVV